MALELRTGLEGRPWYVGALWGLGIAVGLYLLAYNLPIGMKGQKKEHAKLEDRLVRLQVRIQEGRAAQQQLPRFREEVRQLELELDQLIRILPARRNTQELLRRIRALAEQGDFDLVRFRPGNFVERDFYSEWPIRINIQGTYHNLALLFDRISRFSRIINVDTLRIDTLSKSSEHSIKADFQVKTFIYREPEPEPEGPEEGP